MYMTIGVCLLILLLAYMWGSRGFFSALLHMVCVLLAGAIAFAVWEPIGYMFVGAESQFVRDISWGAALALPFIFALLILRVISDKAVPANLDVDNVVNWIGGCLCGLVTGVITAGILVLSVGMMRVPTQVMGYNPVAYNATTGSLIKSGGGFPYVDRLTAGLYSKLSLTTFRPVMGEPLAQLHPDFYTFGPTLRTNWGDGSSKHTVHPDNFTVLGRYTVKGTGDSFGTGGPRRVSVEWLDGPATGDNVHGFVVQFAAGAKEKGGQTLVGSGQMRLVCRNPSAPDDTVAVHPFAMVSQGSGDSERLGRWLFNKQDIYISSVGGTATADMAFEFLVPAGYEPVALYTKGIRTDIGAMTPFQTFPTTGARDAAIGSGSLIRDVSSQSISFDFSQATELDTSGGGREQAVKVSTGLMTRTRVQRDQRLGLQINSDNQITGGSGKFQRERVEGRGGEAGLMIRRFAEADGTRMIQVEITNPALDFVKHPVLSNLDPSGSIYLVDSLDRGYLAVGYMYQETQQVWFSLAPNQPIAKLSDLPRGGPTAARSDQKFILLFQVAEGVSVKGIAIGQTVGVILDPPLEVTAGRR